MTCVRGRRFKYVRIISDTEGVVLAENFPSWFQPDAVVDRRSRLLLEDRGMIWLAGYLAEESWGARNSGSPPDWKARISPGSDRDRQHAADFADYACDDDAEVDAWIEEIQERVLICLNRPKVQAQIEVVADDLLDRGELSYQQVMDLMRKVRDGDARQPS